MSSAPAHLFDRRLVRLRHARAAAQWDQHAFLFERVADEIVARLEGPQPFELALDLSARGNAFRKALARAPGIARTVGRLIEADGVPAACDIVIDDEILPFAPGVANLVVSLLSLHAVNDVPGALVQIARVLARDGLFLGALFGGETLRELRACLADAEIELDGGLSPRVAPFADIQDAAALLQRAGFARPVADREELAVTYASPLALLHDLKGMGESNALALRRRTPLRRATLGRALALYVERHGTSDGRVPATFEILYLTGFAQA